MFLVRLYRGNLKLNIALSLAQRQIEKQSALGSILAFSAQIADMEKQMTAYDKKIDEQKQRIIDLQAKVDDKSDRIQFRRLSELYDSRYNSLKNYLSSQRNLVQRSQMRLQELDDVFSVSYRAFLSPSLHGGWVEWVWTRGRNAVPLREYGDLTNRRRNSVNGRVGVRWSGRIMHIWGVALCEVWCMTKASLTPFPSWAAAQRGRGSPSILVQLSFPRSPASKCSRRTSPVQPWRPVKWMNGWINHWLTDWLTD